MKREAMLYFLNQMKKRRDWHCLKTTPPLQEGVTRQPNNEVKSDLIALNRWSTEAMFYWEAYITSVSSFFDILAKAFTSNWSSGQILYFVHWLKTLLKTNASDPLLCTLQEFHKNHLFVLCNKMRHPSAHEQFSGRDISSIFELKFKQGDPLVMKFLVAKIDDKEIEVVDFLEKFQKEFDDLVDNLAKNYMNESYVFPF